MYPTAAVTIGQATNPNPSQSGIPTPSTSTNPNTAFRTAPKTEHCASGPTIFCAEKNWRNWEKRMREGKQLVSTAA